MARSRRSAPPTQVGVGGLVSASHHVRHWCPDTSRGGGGGNGSGMLGRITSGGSGPSSSSALANALCSSSKVARMCCRFRIEVADVAEPERGGSRAPDATTARRRPMVHRLTCSHADPGGAVGGRRGRCWPVGARPTTRATTSPAMPCSAKATEFKQKRIRSKVGGGPAPRVW
jgi:hypothetical protein